MKLTKKIAQKVLDTVDVGLVRGKGDPVPGQMCVEAAVCFALGLPHGDNPQCVGEAVRSFKIKLNDCFWSSEKARAAGMRRIAVAQLGSDKIDQKKFIELVCIKGVNRILPMLFRWCAEQDDCKDKEKFLAHATACENAKDFSEAQAVSKSAYAYAYASASASAKKKFSEDFFFKLTAEIGCEALVELKTQGSEWLDLCDAKETK